MTIEIALPAVIFTLMLLMYSAGVVRQFRRGRRWSIWRPISFGVGVMLLVLAVYPSHHGHHTFVSHMTQHLLIGMLAPTFLVMAAPISLALRNLPQTAGKNCVRLLHSRPLRIWCHPLTAFGLNFGGMFLLYLTPLYRLSLDSTYIHLGVHFHFLAAGYLFAWSMVGPDPAPARPRFAVRLGILVLAMACHGIFSKLMYVHGFPFDTAHSLDDIRLGAQRMYYGGDLAEVLLVILLFNDRRLRAPRRARRRGRSKAPEATAYMI